MSKKLRTIHNALPIVATAYGQKFGVKVRIGKDMANTDGKTIVVPNIPEDYPHMDALWGYLAHEAAHVRFTDFSVHWDQGLHQRLTNIYEDCRIELALIDIYPGTAHSLNEVARYMAGAGHYQVPSDDSPAASVLEGFCLYHLQCRVVGQHAISDILDQTRLVFERKFPRGVQVRLQALLRKAGKLQNTQQAADLASETMKMIQEEAEKERQKQDQQQGQGQDQQQSSSQAQQDPAQGSQADSSSSNDDQDDGQGAQGQGGNDAGDDDGSTQQSGSGGSDGGDDDQNGQPAGGGADDGSQQQDGASGGSQPIDGSGNSPASGGTSDGGDASKVLQEVLNAGAGDHIADAHSSLRGEMDQLANEQGNDQYMTIRQGQPIAPSEQEGRALRDEVKRTTSRIRTQLMGLVQASQRVGSRNVRHGKRIDARSLHRLNSGDTRVFRRDTPKPRPNTAVHILVDMSGSMGRAGATGKRRFQVASEASMAIALALEAIHGVNPAVTYFGNDGHAPVYNVVRHGENVSRNAGRFVFYPTGTTPMAEAIWYSGYELVQTREERKMLVVVTDGDPDEAMATQAVIDLCERGNVEVIGIGIGSGAVARFFKNHVVIEDVSDLQRTLFRLMERSLAASLVA